MFEELMSGAVITVFAILLAVPIYLVARRTLTGLRSKAGPDHVEMTPDQRL